MSGTDTRASREAPGVYQLLFEQTDEALLVCDARGALLLANPAAHALFGYERGDLVGRHLGNLLASTDATKLQDALEGTNPGASAMQEYRCFRNDGGSFQGELKVQALPDGRRLCVLRDITERTRVVQSISASEALLRSVLETAVDTILTVDREGTVLFINRIEPHFARKELIGKCAFDMVRPNYRARVEQAVNFVFETGGTDDYEVEVAAGFGQWVWSYVRVGPIVEEGEVKAATMCATDITRRKGAEAERAQLEVQLRQAQKEEGIGRLAGGVAHDFNNLLTSIFGFALLAEKALPADSPAIQFIQELVASAQRGAALTQQLLAFTRQKVVQPEIVALNDILRKLVPLLNRLIGEDVDLVLDLASENSQVKVDVGSMEQVVVNLAVNARDAMPGGGELRMETHDLGPDEVPFPSAEGGVMLVVRDTGVGMKPEVLERIFDPFFTTKPTGMGTGLGLPMCQGIVKQAGGQIDVETEYGRGTAFRIYFARAERRPVPSTLVPRPAPALGGSETLLVVEDDAAILKMIRQALIALGYRVLTANDGLEALEVLQSAQARIDLVITDVVMPRMGGHELADRLAAITPETRILFTSGYSEHRIARNGVLREGIHFLQKPYTPDVLAKRIRELLDVDGPKPVTGPIR